MNDKEKKIMEKLVEAHTLFTELKQTHPSDISEWVNNLHGLQKIIGMRIVRRDYPEDFPTHKS